MQTEIYYRDITRTDNLESYLMERVAGAIEEFFPQEYDAHLTVRVETDRHRSQNRKPSYTCEVILKPSHLRSVIKIKKSDEKFKSCVAKTVLALKAAVSRQMGKRSDRRKRRGSLRTDLMAREQIDQDMVAS